MKLIAATLVYLVFAALIAVGVVLATKGSGLFVLVTSLVIFTAFFSKFGCATH